MFFGQEGTVRVGAELLNIGGVTEFCLRPPQVKIAHQSVRREMLTIATIPYPTFTN